MIVLENGVRFNDEQWKKVYRARRQNGMERDGYCFALGIELGENGLVEKHPLTGGKYIKDGKVWTLKQMNVHFYEGGYYWYAVFEDENKSSAPRFFENINACSKMVKSFIEKTKKDFRPIEQH